MATNAPTTPRIPVAGPWITDLEVEYAADAARNGWYDQAGEYPRRFEQALAAYVGVEHAVSLPHCTAGLHLALAALGVGPGDQVIVPDVTWIATSAPISYVGATPVFADIDPDTWCITPEAFEACITEHTRAVILVDLYGNMPKMSAISAIARRHDIHIIEDAAEAIGSEHHLGRAGSFGAAGVFSFHGSKTLVTGEGGALVTDDTALYKRVLFLRDHGRPPGDRFFQNTEVAFKYRMSAMQAAVGLAQIERIEALVTRKKQIFDWYLADLGSVEGLQLNCEPPGTVNSYWMVTALFDPSLGLHKREVMQALSQRGIDSRPFFHPLSSLPAYAKTEQARAARRRNTVSHRIAGYGVNLPSALNLTREQVRQVCHAVKDLLCK
jgi:perosamine synthetase